MIKPVDVLFEMGVDGCDFVVENNDLKAAYSIENVITLALFGGNYEGTTKNDSDTTGSRKAWWGNDIAGIDQLNSTFEQVFKNTVLSPAGIADLINAAKSDLAFLSADFNIEVDGSIPQNGRFQLEITVSNKTMPTQKQVYLNDGLNWILKN